MPACWCRWAAARPRDRHTRASLGVVDLEARPGPAAAHQHRGRAPVSSTPAVRRPARSPSVPRAVLGVVDLEARPGPAAAWLVLLGWAAVCAGGWRPARSPSAPRAALGASSRSPARPCRRPPARRSGPPAPPAPSTPAGPGVLVCCSSFRNIACNSSPALCWFVSVCDVTPLVFVNCMRLLLSAGPAVAHRHRGWAVLTFPVLQADQTGCVRG